MTWEAPAWAEEKNDNKKVHFFIESVLENTLKQISLVR